MSSKKLTFFLVIMLIFFSLILGYYSIFRISSSALELSGISSESSILKVYTITDNLLTYVSYYNDPSREKMNFSKYVVEYLFEDGINTKIIHKNYYTSAYYATKAYKESLKENTDNMDISKKENVVYKIQKIDTSNKNETINTSSIDTIIKASLDEVLKEDYIIVIKDGVVTRVHGNKELKRGE